MATSVIWRSHYYIIYHCLLFFFLNIYIKDLTRRSSSASDNSAELCRVSNPASLINPLHTSYHGELVGSMAEQILKTQRGTCYLTRYSKRRDCYVLSLQFVKGPENVVIYHFRIIVDGDRIWLDQVGGKVEFGSLQSLLHHYQRHPLNHEIHSIGQEYRNNFLCQQGLLFETPVWQQI